MLSILPGLSIDEALGVTKIHSISGSLPPRHPSCAIVASGVPITLSAMLGSWAGGWPRPGQTSLAHRRVLLPDEIPEFGTGVLEVM